jgi:hypothetical protein
LGLGGKAVFSGNVSDIDVLNLLRMLLTSENEAPKISDALKCKNNVGIGYGRMSCSAADMDISPYIKLFTVMDAYGSAVEAERKHIEALMYGSQRLRNIQRL